MHTPLVRVLRCMPIARASSSSLRLFSTASAAHFTSAFLFLSHFLSLSLPLNAFLYLVAPRRRPVIRETAPILGRSARYARCCGRDYPRCGLSKPPGRHPAGIPLTKAFAYRIFDLRPGDALAATHSRCERGNARTRAASRAELLTWVTLLGVVRLSLHRDDFQDVCLLETRARVPRSFYYCFIHASGTR